MRGKEIVAVFLSSRVPLVLFLWLVVMAVFVSCSHAQRFFPSLPPPFFACILRGSLRSTKPYFFFGVGAVLESCCVFAGVRRQTGGKR